MDHKTTDIIFFLPYWDVKNPTLEDQTGFIISEMFEEEECLKIGDKVYKTQKCEIYFTTNSWRITPYCLTLHL